MGICARRAAEGDVERREAAVAVLMERRHLPPRIREQIAMLKKSCDPDKRFFLWAESDIKALSGALLLDLSTAEGKHRIECHLSGVPHPSGVGTRKDRVFPLEHPPYTPMDANPRRFDHVEWAAYCSIISARLVDLEAEIAELAPLQDKHRAEVQALAAYLVPA
jgi:hypothetical protein